MTFFYDQNVNVDVDIVHHGYCNNIRKCKIMQLLVDGLKTIF